MFKFFSISIILLLSNSVFAADDCLECGKRKLNLCSEECALVPSERVKDCQKLCLNQYCQHKCTADSLSELESLFNVDCEGCKELQFPLCNSNCDMKSEFKKATCQIECANSRCQSQCQN